MFMISLVVVPLAFVAWVFSVAIRRDRHGRSVDPHGPFDARQSKAESQSRAYTGP